jgi:hypothetical protein
LVLKSWKSKDDPSTTAKASAIVNLSTLDVGTYHMQFAVFPCGGAWNTDDHAEFTIVNKSRPPVTTFPSEGITLNVQPEPLAANGIWAITTGLALPEGMLA